MKQILVDVGTREEFVMEHIAGAVNIPHDDLEYYRELLPELVRMPHEEFYQVLK